MGKDIVKCYIWSNYTTMQVRGLQENKSLYILIYPGSTQNFINQKVAQLLGCKVESSNRSKVPVADGSRDLRKS